MLTQTHCFGKIILKINGNLEQLNILLKKKVRSFAELRNHCLQSYPLRTEQIK